MSHRFARVLLYVSLLLLCAVGGWRGSATVSAQGGPDVAELTRALTATADMWNRGDIDGFMAPYAATATYMTPDGLIAVDAMRARYLKKYFTGSRPDQQLRFDQLDVRPLGAGHALMTGRFTLAGGGKPQLTGRFTLVWLQTPDGWRILHDHSS